MAGLSSIDISLSLGSIGHFALEWPFGQAAGDLASLLKRDRKVLIFRVVEGHWPLLICAGWLRKWAVGSTVATLSGPDLNGLAAKRVVAYEAGSSQAEQVGAADDILKQIARENLGASATDADRDLSAFGFLVAADASGCVSQSRGFAWREVARVWGDLVQASIEDGAELLWAIEPIGASAMMLKTWAGQRADRSFPHGGPALEFSEARGNLSGAQYIEDWLDEHNVIYVGGSGQEDQRTWLELEGSMATDAMARSEAFHNASSLGTDSTALTDAGNSKLSKLGPIKRLEGTLTESPGQIFGIHWRIGDLVTASHLGKAHKVIIRQVSLSKRGHSATSVLSKFSVRASA